MKADVTEVATCRYKVEIKVDADEVKKEYDQMLDTLRSRVAIKGFRRGHTPDRVIMRRYGEDIAKDVTQKLFQESFTQALKDNELSPLGEPDLDYESLEAVAGKEFAFETEIDVRPKFDLPEYKGIKLVQEIEAVKDEDVEENLENMRKGFAEFKETEEPFKKGYALTADLKMSEAETQIMARDDFRIPPEAVYLMGVEIKDLQEQLDGLKVGEEKLFNVDVPESFYQKDAAGKNVDIKVAVKKIEESILPELNDELAKKVGMESLEKVRERIREGMEAEKKQTADTETAKKLIEDLLAKVEMELPADYINRQVESRTNVAREAVKNADEAGKEEAEKKLAEAESGAREEVLKNVKRSVLLDTIADKEEIEVKEADVMQYIDAMARQYGMPPEQMLKMIQQQNSMYYIVQDVRDGKVIEFMMKNAEIEEKKI